ncbi:hypothetical protein XI03_20815 [Bradyrhizobium sp. CCBAU 65884]|nr:hypothetical protein [Bradyrhizobium sp. CCBAU 65884]
MPLPLFASAKEAQDHHLGRSKSRMADAQQAKWMLTIASLNVGRSLARRSAAPPDRDWSFRWAGSFPLPTSKWDEVQAQEEPGYRRSERSVLQRHNLRGQCLSLIRHPFQIGLLRADVAIELCNFINCLSLPRSNLRESFPAFRC